MNIINSDLFYNFYKLFFYLYTKNSNNKQNRDRIADVNELLEHATEQLMVVRPYASNRFEEVLRGGVYRPAVAMYTMHFT